MGMGGAQQMNEKKLRIATLAGKNGLNFGLNSNYCKINLDKTVLIWKSSKYFLH